MSFSSCQYNRDGGLKVKAKEATSNFTFVENDHCHNPADIDFHKR